MSSWGKSKLTLIEVMEGLQRKFGVGVLCPSNENSMAQCKGKMMDLLFPNRNYSSIYRYKYIYKHKKSIYTIYKSLGIYLNKI